MEKNSFSANEFVAIKAKTGGVQIIGLTRGGDTKSHHTENLEKGEVLLVQFTDWVSAIKIRGNAEIYTGKEIITSEKG